MRAFTVASRLQEAQNSLAFAIQIIHVSVCPVVPETPWRLTLGRKLATSACAESRTSSDGIRSEIRQVRAILDRNFTTSTERNSLDITRPDSFSSNHTQPENRIRTTTRWILQNGWIDYGVQLALTSIERTHFTSNILAVKIPIPSVVGKSALIVDLSVRSCALGLPDISCRLLARNIIPMSAEIVKACETQDLATVKYLLQRRRYGPNDITEDFRPILWVSCYPSLPC